MSAAVVGAGAGDDVGAAVKFGVARASAGLAGCGQLRAGLVGVAGYPETHPEAVDPEQDLDYLKLKLDQGGDFAITQLFFDNNSYFDFVARARAAGVTKPIIPGIIPVVSLKVIRRIVSMCGALLPPAYLAELEEADRSGGAAAVQRLGVAYARRQAQDLLAAGVPGVHIYTLNRDEAVLELVDGLLPG